MNTNTDGGCSNRSNNGQRGAKEGLLSLDGILRMEWIIYQYTNSTRDSVEHGFTYTGQTQARRERIRRNEHESCGSTNSLMKVARERGDTFDYRVVERMSFTYYEETDTDWEKERTTFEIRVTEREAAHMSMWGDGGYNLRDETSGESACVSALWRKAIQALSDQRWNSVIQPALQKYFDAHKEIYSVPQSHPVIGRIVNSMRNQGCYIGDRSGPKAAERRRWLEERKWADSHDDGKWTYVIQPALQKYFDEHKEIASVPRSHPVIGFVDRMRKGAYIGDRSGPKAVERRRWLEPRGFVYHTRDLARHLSMCVTSDPIQHLIAANAAIAKRRATHKRDHGTLRGAPRLLFPKKKLRTHSMGERRSFDGESKEESHRRGMWR